MRTILLLFLASFASGGAQQYNHKDSLIDNEFESVYRSIKENSISDPLTLNALTVSTLTVTSSTTLTGFYVPSTAFTPTFSAGWGTVSNVFARYTKIGKSVKVWGVAQIGTVAAAGGDIFLPTGITIDDSEYDSAAKDWLGMVVRLGGAASTLFSGDRVALLKYDGSNTDRVTMAYQGSGNSFPSNDVSSFFSTNEYISFQIEYVTDQ